MKRLRFFAFVLLVCAVAEARPGGGQSFSGGSRSSGGGGGGGSRTSGGGGGGSSFHSTSSGPTVYSSSSSSSSGNPMPFFIIFGVVIALVIAKQVFGNSNSTWATATTSSDDPIVPPTPSTLPRTVLEELRPIDPEFSNVLFEDFVYMLYAEIHRARAHGFQSIAAFVAPPVAQLLAQQGLADVRGIIIGAMRITAFPGIQFAQIQVELEIESNYVEVDRNGKEHRYYAVERMTLRRARTAKSRPPKRARTLDCPNCGAPLSAMRGTQCSYCKQDTGGGRFDWCVEAFQMVSKESRGPLLTSSVEEVGTDFPTLIAAGAQQRLDAIKQRDPAFDFQAVLRRVGVIFDSLQQGWSGRDASRIRPFVTDNLFQSMMYWIDLYVQQRCRNMNDGARIQKIELANVISDPHYDAITLRIFALGADYTISDDGKILSGSKNQRHYSEYWTVIRGVGKQTDPSKADPLGCPNCGAPLKISMVGNCDHCGVKVTSGEFDWVLSRIEQDEVYSG